MPGFANIMRVAAIAYAAATVLMAAPSLASDAIARSTVTNDPSEIQSEIQSQIQNVTLSAQRRARITVYPRRQRLSSDARRHCEAWLAREYRVSGPVIVPHQRCWWQ